jgi:hypothetical protein
MRNGKNRRGGKGALDGFNSAPFTGIGESGEEKEERGRRETGEYERNGASGRAEARESRNASGGGLEC